MNRNAFDLRRLMGELDEIQESGLFDVRGLMDALYTVESNPSISNEKAKEIVEGVKEEIKELRRSSRIAGLKLKKEAQAAMAANVNMTYNRSTKKGTVSRRGRSRSANKGRASRRSPERRGRSRSRSRGRKYSRERAPMRNNRAHMRNNRTRNNKPNSEKLTGAAKDKSLYDQALFILNNKAKIISSTKTFEITYYKKQYEALVNFIHGYPGNTHIKLLKEAADILKSNPAV